VRVEGEPGQAPKNQPMTEADIRKQLMKTGDTPFIFGKLAIQMDGDIFCPNGQLNRMRREALEKLTEQCTAGTHRASGDIRKPLTCNGVRREYGQKGTEASSFSASGTVGAGRVSAGGAGFSGGTGSLSDQRKAGF